MSYFGIKIEDSETTDLGGNMWGEETLNSCRVRLASCSLTQKNQLFSLVKRKKCGPASNPHFSLFIKENSRLGRTPILTIRFPSPHISSKDGPFK